MIFEEKWISSGQIRAINQIRKEGRTSSNIREPKFKLGGSNLYIYVATYTEHCKMSCMWFGEIGSCCSFAVLPGPAWVLLSYVTYTILGLPVQEK